MFFRFFIGTIFLNFIFWGLDMEKFFRMSRTLTRQAYRLGTLVPFTAYNDEIATDVICTFKEILVSL